MEFKFEYNNDKTQVYCCNLTDKDFAGEVITPDLPLPAPIETDECGNKFRLNESKDGYIAEHIHAKGLGIDVPKEFNGLPVVELGDRAFSGNDEAFRTYIPSTVKKAGDFPFYGCDEMNSASYGGTMAEWKAMNIYTWFNVYCSDGTIENW